MVLNVWCSSQAAATESCARSHAPEYQHLVGTARMQTDGHISLYAVERDVDQNRSPEVGFGTWHSRTTIRTYRALGNPVTGASLVCDFGPGVTLHFTGIPPKSLVAKMRMWSAPNRRIADVPARSTSSLTTRTQWNSRP